MGDASPGPVGGTAWFEVRRHRVTRGYGVFLWLRAFYIDLPYFMHVFTVFALVMSPSHLFLPMVFEPGFFYVRPWAVCVFLLALGLYKLVKWLDDGKKHFFAHLGGLGSVEEALRDFRAWRDQTIVFLGSMVLLIIAYFVSTAYVLMDMMSWTTTMGSQGQPSIVIPSGLFLVALGLNPVMFVGMVGLLVWEYYMWNDLMKKESPPEN